MAGSETSIEDAEKRENKQFVAEIPNVLQNFARHLMSNNPSNSIDWSARYFQAMARDACARPMRFGVSKTTRKLGRFLAPEDLKNLVLMAEPDENHELTVTYDLVQYYWHEEAIAPLILQRLMLLGKFPHSQNINLDLFVALACTMLTINLRESLAATIRTLTGRNIPQQVQPSVELARVKQIYLFLCALDPKIEEGTVKRTIEYLEIVSERYPPKGFVGAAEVANDMRVTWEPMKPINDTLFA